VSAEALEAYRRAGIAAYERRVRDSEGRRVGSVHRVLGEPERDIFHGLVVAGVAFRGRREILAERVRAIGHGWVEIDASGALA
jgi:hypothetical protein